ncbi:hypothetical protein PGQ11_010008 [Apiospora arundinis]|uniref:Uncharacterized protein n=1 Tax=Apiospora arundinis TaxID=335852 RepID=A0ABR2I8E5_9PEZI
MGGLAITFPQGLPLSPCSRQINHDLPPDTCPTEQDSTVVTELNESTQSDALPEQGPDASTEVPANSEQATLLSVDRRPCLLSTDKPPCPQHQRAREEFRSNANNVSRRYGHLNWRPHNHNSSMGDITEHGLVNFQFLHLEGDVWVLNAKQLRYARSSGIISELYHIAEDELDDKGNGDAVVKSLALVQILWIGFQLLTRVVTKKLSSPLDCNTGVRCLIVCNLSASVQAPPEFENAILYHSSTSPAPF